jgi:hypothetical protein
LYHRSDYPTGRNWPTVKVSKTSMAVTTNHASAGIAAILTAAGNLIRARRIRIAATPVTTTTHGAIPLLALMIRRLSGSA